MLDKKGKLFINVSNGNVNTVMPHFTNPLNIQLEDNNYTKDICQALKSIKIEGKFQKGS